MNSVALAPTDSHCYGVVRQNGARLEHGSGEGGRGPRGHDATVNSAAFSPDGTRIVTGSWDNTARVWDAATAKQLAVLRGHEFWVTSVGFAPMGRASSPQVTKLARLGRNERKGDRCIARP